MNENHCDVQWTEWDKKHTDNQEYGILLESLTSGIHARSKPTTSPIRCTFLPYQFDIEWRFLVNIIINPVIE